MGRRSLRPMVLGAPKICKAQKMRRHFEANRIPPARRSLDVDFMSRET
jgi:hypothetical protein